MIRREPQAKSVLYRGYFEGSYEAVPPGCLTFGLGGKGVWVSDAVRVVCGKFQSTARRKEDYEATLRAAMTQAVLIGNDPTSKRQFWLFGGEFYSDVEQLNPDEVTALLIAKQRKREARIRTAMAAAGESPSESRRPSISDDVKMFVWQRDRGRCVKCASTANLEYDHVIPVSMGGANTARNLQLLCEQCNRLKGGDLT